MSEELRREPEPIQDPKLGLLKRIQADPCSDEIWKDVVRLAREEESSGAVAEGYYAEIPLDELIALGEKLMAARAKDKENYSGPFFYDNPKQEEYRVLTGKPSTGEYWYDIILGHVNDRAFAPVTTRLEDIIRLENNGKKFEAGLDVGSGLGNTLRQVAPYCEKVTGAERIDFLVKEARNNPAMPKNAKIIKADAKRLPFDAESFDLVVSNGMTHYMGAVEMQEYVREISGILKKGGRYFEVLVEEDPASHLALTETEYLSSAKALLVCLLDNVVSRVGDKGSEEWDLGDMADAFSYYGVSYRPMSEEEEDSITKKTGVIVVEFIKSN